jgi:hypothetical protein
MVWPENDRMVSWWGLRSAIVLILALAVLPASSGIAAAHYAGGLTPSASRCEIRLVDPPVAGLRVTVIEAGARLEIDNQTGATVDVLPEPNTDRLREPTVPPGGSARWSDSRIVAAGQAPDPANHRRAWAIPLRVGDQAVTIHGEQVWPPPPPAGRWWLATGLAALVAVVIGALAVRQRWAAVVLGTATAAIAAAHFTHLVGSILVFPPDQSRLAMIVGLAGPAIAAWPLAVIGPALAIAGHPSGPMVCGLFGALLVLFSASDVVSFFYAVLPFGWNPNLDRATTALVVGGGFGLFLTGILALRAVSRAVPPAAQLRSTTD